MSRADLFAKYNQMYQKAQVKEIVPDGPFVKQLLNLPRRGLDVGVFFKAKRRKAITQVYMGNPIPEQVAREEGFLEAGGKTYLSRTILSNFKNIDFLRVVISIGRILSRKDERVQFLKQCQRIVDVVIRKAKNVMYTDNFEPFRFDKQVVEIGNFLSKTLKMDDVTVEAASIPITIANPEYILLSNQKLVVIGKERRIPIRIFYLAGGIGYTFDKTIGAVNEERLFRTTADLSQYGIDSDHLDVSISRVTEDFQNRVHSLIFADIWKKSKAKPAGANFGGDLLIKPEPSSDIWSGVFEVYIAPPE
ncbi:MAG: hypothetical protein KAT22_01210 [Candidatus Thorarchaeota archaeon]|nr:hypothetical protein [Candidatus Thorarchaeota archaeon]